MKSVMIVLMTLVAALSFYLSVSWCLTAEPFLSGYLGIACNVFFTVWMGVAGYWLGAGNAAGA